MTFDAVVFGGGLAGLSCARRLALYGRRVCLLEKAPELGGHLAPFERRGVTFEVGIHYIASCGAGSLFAKACSELRINPDLVPLDEAFEELRFSSDTAGASGGSSWLVRSPFAAYMADLRVRFPAASTGLDQFMCDAEGLWRVANSLEFPLETTGLIKGLLLSPNRFRLARLATLTLREYLSNLLRLPDDAVETIALQHLLIGVPPSRASALVALLVHRYYFERACFLRGGGRALAAMLRHPSVEYVTGADATFRKEGRREGFVVEWGGKRCEAKRLIWTPDPRLLPEATKENLGPLLRWRLNRAEEPHALVVGYFATKRNLTEYGFSNRNYWLMGELNSEAAYGDLPLATLARKGPVYLSTGSLRDPLAVPEDNALGARGVFQAMFLVPPHHSEWGGDSLSAYRRSAAIGGFRETYLGKKGELLTILKARICEQFPGVRDELVWQELGTPLTHSRYLHSLSQNGYGFSPTVFDLLAGRPSYKTAVPGLYLCGAHIKPAHGIATALSNGVGLANYLGELKDT